MTKVLLSSGQPLAEARSQLRRIGMPGPIPTGDATTASSTIWTTTATAHATPHTKGSWTQVVAATTADIYGLLIGLETSNTGATDTSVLLDVGVGAAASEVVAVQDLAAGWRTSALPNVYDPYYRVPVFIPSGSRIAVRCQSAVTVKAIKTVIAPMARSFGPRRPSTTVTALNSNTATSYGTSLGTPGATNTKTAWTQLVAATAEPYTALMVGIQGGGNTVQASSNCLVDIGVGASGSEVVVVPNLLVATSAAEMVRPFDSGSWLVNVPTGSRIAARVAQSATTSTLDVIVYGIR